jgi:hypothetical protein
MRRLVCRAFSKPQRRSGKIGGSGGRILAGSRSARIAYAFLCTIGLMAVAFGLPAEYRVFPLGFVLSSVECVLKATAFVCLVSAGIYPEEA